jgi:flagellar hook-associated protein 2
MPITATGLGSGLDVESLVAQLVLSDIQPAEQRIIREEAQYQAELSAYGIVSSALSDFQTALGTASNLGNYTAFESTSSSDDVSAIASSSAQAGSYSVEVQALASKQTLATAAASPFSATSEIVGEGTITIQTLAASSEAVTITIDSSNSSLSGIRDAINQSDAEVSASIVNDGTGYRLVLTSANSGLDGRFDLSVSETSDDGVEGTGLSQIAYSSTAGSGNLEQVQTASDAAFSVNGLSISSTTNQISTAIEGLTITLAEVTSNPVEITVTKNTALAESAVNNFVASYNRLEDSLSGLSAYNEELTQASTLTGDATVRTIFSGIQNLINTPVANVGGNYATLAELGITTNVESGNLEIDSTTLDAVLAANPLDVANVFSRVARSDDDSLSFVSSTDQTQAGQYAVTYSETATAATYTGGAVTANNNNATITFDLNVNGSVQTISYVGSGNPSGTEVATGLTSAITTAFGSAVATVSFSSGATDFYTITSTASGAGNTVDIDAISGADTADFGFAVAEGTAGSTTYIASIDGEAASFDSTTNRISAASGTDAEGLTFEVLGGVSSINATVNYGIGIASSLGDLVAGFLATDGLLDARTTGINSSIDDLTGQLEALSLRADSLEQRYRSQFNGLETLISQFTATQTFLSQALQNFVEPMSFVKK